MAGRAQLARPPYVDPNTNIIYDTDRPEYEGWLTKQSMWLKVRVISKTVCSCMWIWTLLSTHTFSLFLLHSPVCQ